MAPLFRTKPLARRALAAQSDRRLVRLLREGHEAAFEEIVRRYQDPLTAFAAAIVPFHRAEDVVQASLLKAHEALLADSREVSLRAWLFTIVRNGALNVVRDEPDWQQLDPGYDGVPQPPAIAEQNEELQALVTAICALPADQRKALVGRELMGAGHAELAAQLGTTTTAIRGLIFRARSSIRNALGAAIPLPLLRALLVEAPAVGAAGAGAMTIGGGAKVAAALSAAAIAVGGGIALEHGPEGKRGPAEAQAAEGPEDGSGPDAGARRPSGPAGAPATTAGSRHGSNGHEGSNDASGSGGSSSGRDHQGTGSTEGSSGSGGDDGPGTGGHGGHGDDGGGHSGPGGGETENGGGHSGSGDDSGSDDGSHTGPGGGETEHGGDSGSGGSSGGESEGGGSGSGGDDTTTRESDSGSGPGDDVSGSAEGADLLDELPLG